MKKNQWIIGAVILILIIIGLGIWVWYGGSKTEKSNNTIQNQTNNTPSQGPSYFSETASVMYFWSATCHWCQKEKEVLEKLGAEGYKVKSMDVGKNKNLWKEYNIEGTPTFVAANGDRLVGYQEYDELKKFLDEHK